MANRRPFYKYGIWINPPKDLIALKNIRSKKVAKETAKWWRQAGFQVRLVKIKHGKKYKTAWGTFTY
jgi:hypothetical protein